MLDLIGFIVLLVIIFGVYFVAVLDGALKIIVLAILLVIAVALMSKMFSTKKGCIFVLAAAAVAVCLGALGLINNPNLNLDFCNMFDGLRSSAYCSLNPSAQHDVIINRSWGLIIAGVVAFLVSIWGWYNAKEKDG